MKSDDSTRQIQYLASVLALVSGYYAIRASLQLPKFRALFVNIEDVDQPLSVGMLILNHPNWFLALVVTTLIATLLAIWKTFKYHDLVFPVGIGFQFFLADRAVASGLDPILRMISIVGAQ